MHSGCADGKLRDHSANERDQPGRVEWPNCESHTASDPCGSSRGALSWRMNPELETNRGSKKTWQRHVNFPPSNTPWQSISYELPRSEIAFLLSVSCTPLCRRPTSAGQVGSQVPPVHASCKIFLEPPHKNTSTTAPSGVVSAM